MQLESAFMHINHRTAEITSLFDALIDARPGI